MGKTDERHHRCRRNPRRPPPTNRRRRDARCGLGERHDRRADPAGHRRCRRRPRRCAGHAARPTCSTRPTACATSTPSCSCGGSAYGLAAADGVMHWLEEHGRGVAMDGGVVPIVPAAVVFDLPVGGWQCRPTAEFGYAAAEAAGTEVARRHCRRGGRRPRRRAQGRRRNRVGDARHRRHRRRDRRRQRRGRTSLDTATGLPWQADQIEEFGLTRPPADQIAAFAARNVEFSPLNTTIAVVATDAALSTAGCRRVAIAAHDGLARTIRPCHTPLDGDTVFALATGAVEVPPDPETPGVDVAGSAADHRRRGRRGRCAGPGGARRRACGRVGSRNTDLPGHVARSVRRTGLRRKETLTCW